MGKIQDSFTEGLLLMLIEEVPKALAEPQNYDVRSNLIWCAILGEKFDVTPEIVEKILGLCL